METKEYIDKSLDKEYLKFKKTDLYKKYKDNKAFIAMYVTLKHVHNKMGFDSLNFDDKYFEKLTIESLKDTK